MKYLKNEILPELENQTIKINNIPKPSHKQYLPTLILDLDETLVHYVESIDSSSCIHSVHEIAINCSPDEPSFPMQLSLRPFLKPFLEETNKLFELIIFTASEKKYALKVVELIDPEGIFIDGILSREDCIQVKNSQYIKDIRCLNRKDGSVVIIDNSLGAVRQIESLIPIVSYYGDEQDTQLKEILPYLKQLAKEDDLVKKNQEMFQWKLFCEVENYQEYFKKIRKNKNYS